MSEQIAVAVAPTTMALAGISKHYGGVAALADVSLDIREGEVHALLGENGAGKSTLMSVASGAVSPDTGSVTVGGTTFAALTPASATELGIAMVHQHPAVMPDMTVRENIRVAVPSQHLGGDGTVAMRGMLADVGCSAHLEDRVSSLSVAQKHLLELAKALAVKPSLLILDEPTAPLGQASVELLFNRVRAAAERGTAVVYITQIPRCVVHGLARRDRWHLGDCRKRPERRAACAGRARAVRGSGADRRQEPHHEGPAPARGVPARGSAQ